jgi:hypothetical protein
VFGWIRRFVLFRIGDGVAALKTSVTPNRIRY